MTPVTNACKNLCKIERWSWKGDLEIAFDAPAGAGAEVPEKEREHSQRAFLTPVSIGLKGS
jgi:hypothetical protein